MKKSATRNALFMSVLSLLLCVSMLVGTTFAWFTDEVTSGMNTIAAGNLDIELYHTNAAVTNEQVKADTELFFDLNGQEIKWEPGVVSYENLEIANVGSLALQYRLSLNIDNENNLNGHKLSEVLKVVFLDEAIEAGATRAEVLAKAKAAVEASPLDGTLDQLVEQGTLLPGDNSGVRAMVIFWEPNSNDVDNQYNANNGQKTSDGKPLHVSFGVKLEATQLMHENDSFGPNYDKFTGFRPIAAVNGTDNTIDYTNSIGAAAETVTLDAAYQFRPTESADEADLSEYLYYKVDFEVSADRDVPAGSIMLAGYYSAWCDVLNDGNWLALSNEGMDVTAGTKIRLVEGLGSSLGGSVAVHYKDLVDYGNDGIGFLCGVKDLTGANAGTTLTVKLNMYATERDPNTGDGDSNAETGEVITIGTFTYTFPAYKVNNSEELADAIANKISNIELAPGEYRIPSDRNNTAELNISGPKSAVVDMTWGLYLDKYDVSFTGITVKTGTGHATSNGVSFGSDYAALYSKGVVYNDCAFIGPMRVGWNGAAFNGCTFSELGNDYVWTYGNDVSFDSCTFNSDGKALLIYSDGHGEVSTVSVTNCVFNATAGAKAGAIVNQNCAAIEIDNFGCGVNLTTDGNTVDEDFSGEWRIKSYDAAKDPVSVNGTAYDSIAIDGKTMTKDSSNNVTVNP